MFTNEKYIFVETRPRRMIYAPVVVDGTRS